MFAGLSKSLAINHLAINDLVWEENVNRIAVHMVKGDLHSVTFAFRAGQLYLHIEDNSNSLAAAITGHFLECTTQNINEILSLRILCVRIMRTNLNQFPIGPQISAVRVKLAIVSQHPLRERQNAVH